MSVIAVPPGGKKSILLAANANDAWDGGATRELAELVAAAPSGSLLSLDCEVPADVVRAAARAARARGFPMVVDPSWPDRVDPGVLADALAVAPNPAETEMLVGIKPVNPASAVDAARRLAARGPALALVKLEDGGCVLAERGGGVVHIPAQPVTVVDTTGAGDAFTGALAVALLEGRPPRDAALFAGAASHAAVTAWGSQPVYPDRAVVESRIPDLACAMQDWSR